MDTQTQSDKADELFNLTLEVEGLLALIRRREDFTAPEVYTLLLDKVAALAEGVGELCPDPSCTSAKCDGTASQTLTKEQKFLESVPSLPGLWDDEDDTVTEAEMEEAVSEAERTADEATDAQVATETPAEIAATEAKVDEQIASAVLFETEEDADETPSMAAEERVEQEAPKEAAAPAPAKQATPAVKRQPGDLRRSFTINDKFRFRRELFGNSDSEFTDALNLVEAMGSYDEAEDYFITDLSWDREMPEVGEFLTVIEHYFN